MAHEAELSGLAIPFAIELCVGIGRALMSIVGAYLAVEVALRVAAGTVSVVVPAILLAEALDRSPGVDQRPVDREMIAGKKPLHLGLGEDRGQELGGNITLEQTIAVGREA